ncbi:thioesterase II family protein [Flavobacterium panici]|uniref:Linear gramicidin dehydrogenase LgrE n=1 Tax=Flavobacterium panici TaxID=2654843 RepID=A0A9N8J3J9_9FLAO|nr:thioesterase [Flavobacterium panici]CAC9975503.1 Linear gramicidin dehydrogenase LgrE [Flavobacterium panici]
MTEKIKLFCLPFAGGASSIYRNWGTGLADNIELCPIELAGRGIRIAEDCYANLEEAVEDIFNQISDDISKSDYAIFGHSMGASLGYEVLQKIMSLGMRPPIHAFFSGRYPPDVQRVRELWSLMGPQEFQEKVLALGVTPPEIFQHPELSKIFIPLLRSDFAIAETMVHRPEIIPLKVNISVLIGESEGISRDTAVKWKAHTTKRCSIYYIEGGHFFLLKEKDAVIKIINASLVQQNLEFLI